MVDPGLEHGLVQVGKSAVKMRIWVRLTPGLENGLVQVDEVSCTDKGAVDSLVRDWTRPGWQDQLLRGDTWPRGS